MESEKNQKALSFMTERFGQDTLLSLATMDGNRPSVRIVNSYYEDGAFYTVTYALSNKIKQIKKIPKSLYAASGLPRMVWVKTSVMYGMRKMLKSCQSSTQYLRSGMIMVILMKMTRIPACSVFG